MKRLLYNELKKWKNNPNRKPLLLQGARQVGKTYLIKEFAKNEYNDFIYLNFEENKDLMLLFVETLNPKKIIENIEIKFGKKIDFNNTLIIFDEIQIVPNSIKSLKYFNEELPECHIIAAGSLLGVSVGKNSSFPVGKVNFLTLYPMNFEEYLYAVGNELLIERLLNIDIKEKFPEILHKSLLNYFKEYLFLGGMPEIIKTYIVDRNVQSVRQLQKDILEAYKRDFSKYTTKQQTIKTMEFWESIPIQLSRENKKFKYSEIKKGARSSHYISTIDWLNRAGLINIVYNVKKARIPLSGYADRTKFKIYLNDIGLLGSMLDVSAEILLNPCDEFKYYYGAIIENYVSMELKVCFGKDYYYWKSKSDAEIDFIIQYNDLILPIEVKSGTNRNMKSLRSYQEKFSPKILIRISPRNFYKNKNFINIPLYSIFVLKHIIKFIENGTRFL